MASNKAVTWTIVATACVIAAYAAYRLIPRKRSSNGTPATGAAGGAVGTSGDDYPEYYPQQSGLGSLLSSLLGGLGKGGGSGSSPAGAGGGGGGLLPGSNVNAYNVLYDAQHNLNQDGTPINYGDAATTDTLAQSINAQIAPTSPSGGWQTLDVGEVLNPISDSSASTDSAALQINPAIPEEPVQSSNVFTDWWNNFTGNPVNQPDASAGLDSTDTSSYSAGQDYTNSDYGDVGDTSYSGGDQTSNYDGSAGVDSGSGDYTDSGDSGDNSGSYDDSSSYDYSSTDGGGY